MRIDVNEAIAIIESGGVVALPTETVYGLAASIAKPQGVEKLFSLKGRPANNPLIVHVESVDAIKPFVEKFPHNFDRLAETFWPGPLTIVLPIAPNSLDIRITAGLLTAAFRIPNHPATLSVIRHLGPLVMPSANLSGRPSSTDPSHIEQDFGIEFPVVDGGPCKKGIESTVLVYAEHMWTIARPGVITKEELFSRASIEAVPAAAAKREAPLCPGQLYKHYSPKARLLTDLPIPESCEAVVGFDERSYPKDKIFFSLGSINDPRNAAHTLYRTLRELDDKGIKIAWIDSDLPKMALWLTIAERIEKASDSCR